MSRPATGHDDELDPQTRANILSARTVRGIPPTEPLVASETIGEVLAERAQSDPHKVFLIFYDEQHARRQFMYLEFANLVNQTANFLQEDLGVRRGERLATIAHNHPNVLLLYFAAWQIGATVAPQNVAEDDQRIAYILRNSGVRLLFVLREYLARAQRICAAAPGVERIVPIDGGSEAMQAEAGQAYPAVDFQHGVAEQPITFTARERPGREDECLLVYTSGTTGAPKGVVLTQYNLLVDAWAQNQWDQVTAGDRFMCVLPIHHVNGIVVTHIAPLLAGASVVLNRQFTAGYFWRRLAEERVSISSVVPTLLQFLVEANDDPGRYDLSRLRYLICGAGTLSVGLAQRFEQQFGVKIVHGYGLSETTAYACHLPVDLSDDEHRRWLTSFGYPSIGCAFAVNEMSVFDAQGDGRELPEGERGEIALRGHNVMKYYFQRPEANRETFKYGWFRSGDEGFFKRDAYGRKFFFITGRLKELINRGGVKFSPFEIEEALLEIPGVRVGLAIAFENKYFGEEIGAYVVPEVGMHLEAERILEHCRQRLGFEKSPKVVVFGKDVPVTATGKYQRLLLKPMFEPWRDVQFRQGSKR